MQAKSTGPSSSPVLQCTLVLHPLEKTGLGLLTACLPRPTLGAAVCRARLEDILCLKPTRPKFSRKPSTHTVSASSIPLPPPLVWDPWDQGTLHGQHPETSS